MLGKHYSREQILDNLRVAESMLRGGKSTDDVCRQLGFSERTLYYWYRKYSGLPPHQARRLKGFQWGAF